mmetsp:Transcript_6259/g.15929  ORF Transcript_6259/g.15929 Transcript_6259/m.15929 type:complete len:249 (+) Transcript_6259:1380-2126(+)
MSGSRASSRTSARTLGARLSIIADGSASSFATLASASKTWACLATEADALKPPMCSSNCCTAEASTRSPRQPSLRHERATSSYSNGEAHAVNLYAAGWSTGRTRIVSSELPDASELPSSVARHRTMAVCPSCFVSCVPSERFQIMIEVSSPPDASRSPSSVVRHWTDPVCPSSLPSCAPSSGFQRMIELSPPPDASRPSASTARHKTALVCPSSVDNRVLSARLQMMMDLSRPPDASRSPSSTARHWT